MLGLRLVCIFTKTFLLILVMILYCIIRQFTTTPNTNYNNINKNELINIPDVMVHCNFVRRPLGTVNLACPFVDHLKTNTKPSYFPTHCEPRPPPPLGAAAWTHPQEARAAWYTCSTLLTTTLATYYYNCFLLTPYLLWLS